MSRRNDLSPEERPIMAEYHNGQDYQKWLMDLIKMKDYTKLFKILYETEFTWVHPFDENRAQDGISLRYRFTQNEFDSAGRNTGINRRGHEYRSSMEDIPCSVLEMLIALAINIEDSIMYDPEKGDRTAKWFWMMLNNLNLIHYNDKYLNSLSKKEFISAYSAIRAILHIFMDREYNKNGRGGLFPLKNSYINQKDEELWYQANIYILEEFGL